MGDEKYQGKDNLPKQMETNKDLVQSKHYTVDTIFPWNYMKEVTNQRW